MWNTRGALLKLVSGDGNKYFNGSEPKLAVEPSPTKRPHLDKVGRMLNVLNGYGVPRSTVKPEWSPPESKIVIKNPGERSIIMATWEPSKGWKVYEAELQKLVTSREITSAELIGDVRES